MFVAAKRPLLALILAPLACACAPLPRAPAESGLYQDLRKVVDVSERDGWTVDRVRIQANAEPALRSVCQVTPETRHALDAWLGARIAAEGGPAADAYRANGGDLSAVEDTLSLERTRALLRYAERRAAQDCPFWLTPDPGFVGVQADVAHWIVLGETQGFATLELPGNVPALGGGGRLFLGHGIGSQLTLAGGGDVAASGTFLPSQAGGQAVDVYVTVAAPVMLRVTRFSRMFDVELAPVLRLSHQKPAWPPGGRIELGYGFSSVRSASLMTYFTLYAGYELHVSRRNAADHTFQLGTRLAFDWAP